MIQQLKDAFKKTDKIIERNKRIIEILDKVINIRPQAFSKNRKRENFIERRREDNRKNFYSGIERRKK